jgi:hypothetical protein
MGGGGLRGARSGSGDEPTRGPFSHPSAGRVDGYSRTDLQFAFHPTAEGVVSLDLIIRFATDDVRRYASPLTRTENREGASECVGLCERRAQTTNACSIVCAWSSSVRRVLVAKLRGGWLTRRRWNVCPPLASHWPPFITNAVAALN